MRRSTTLLGLIAVCCVLLGPVATHAAEFLDLDAHDQATLARCLQEAKLQGGATHTVEPGDTLSYIINGGPPGKDYPRNYVPRSDFHNFQMAVRVVEDLVKSYHNAMNRELESASADIADVDRIYDGNVIYLPSGDELVRIVNGEAPRAVVREKLENPDTALRRVVSTADLEKWADAQTTETPPVADPGAVASAGDGRTLLGVAFREDHAVSAEDEAALPEAQTLDEGLNQVLAEIRSAIGSLDLGGRPGDLDGFVAEEVDPDYYIPAE